MFWIRRPRDVFAEGIASDHKLRRRFHFAIDVDWMRILRRERAVFFVFDRWINKSLSIRGIQVYYDDYLKDAADLDFPYWAAGYSIYPYWAAGYSIYEFMKDRFPWLEYEYADDIEEHAGEIETHVLSVNLTGIARKFLEVEEFFKTGEPSRKIPIVDLEGFTCPKILTTRASTGT